MVMKKLASGITSVPANKRRELTALKTAQDATTSHLASDSAGMIGNGDADYLGFFTKPFKDMKLFQQGNQTGVVGTIALMPTQQHASLETPYFAAGTPFTLDRAGDGNFGFNVVKSGNLPAGYYGGDKVLVQKRYKIYPAGENYPNIYVYGPPVVREEPKGYVLGEDERYDGSFYPGKILFGVGRPIGTTFPTDSEGHYVYNDSPFIDAGWSGATYSVPFDPETRPVISSVTPDYYTIPGDDLPEGSDLITLTGINFNSCGYVMIGPYLPSVSVPGVQLPELAGAYFNRIVISDEEIQFNRPGGMMPGIYEVYVIGNDGQMNEEGHTFTVYAEGGPPNP
jgi:hypothetical protein